jgi:hypothetical protein
VAARDDSSAELQAYTRCGVEQVELVSGGTAISGASNQGAYWPRQDGVSVGVAEGALAVAGVAVTLAVAAVSAVVVSTVAVAADADMSGEAAEQNRGILALQASVKRGAERAGFDNGKAAASKTGGALCQAG